MHENAIRLRDENGNVFVDAYAGLPDADLRREERALAARFEETGGRGVELADRLDALRALLGESTD